jgi:hypothetical protein
MYAADSPSIAVERAAGVVAVGQLLDLDDVGTHVGEHEAARRPGHDVRELDHLAAPASGPMRQRPLNSGFALVEERAVADAESPPVPKQA